MNGQLSLFAPPTPFRVETPAARRADPESSKRAAEAVTTSGCRAAQLARVIDAVRKHPGRTSMELAALTGLDRYMLARRLPEAVTAGAVAKGAQRECTTSHRLALTWQPVHSVELAA